MNRRAASRALFGVAVVLLAVTTARVSSQVPVFTTAFPAEEFAAHRAALFATIGDGLAVVQGAARPGPTCHSDRATISST